MGAAVDYLFSDPKTGRLSFRRVYPAELRPHIPGAPRELKRTLAASDIKQPGAMDRFKAAAEEYDRTLRNARKAAAGTFDPLDSATIAYLAEAFRVESLEQDEESRWTDGEGKELGYGRKKRETLSAMLPVYRQLQADGCYDRIEDLWEEEAEALAEARGLRVDKASPEFRQLCAALNRAAIQASEVKLARLDGQVIDTPPEPQPPMRTRSAPEAPSKREGEGFVVIAERLIAKPRLGLSATTKEAYRTALRFWREGTGSLEPKAVQRSTVAEWLDMLSQRPNRLPASERILPLPEVVKRYGDRDDVTRMSAKTVAQHLGSLGSLWKKAQADGEIAVGLANPFSGHTISQSRRVKQAKGFSRDELNSIFALPVFTEGERPRRGKGEASYWLPLLLLWTGARPEEIAQLTVSDVFQSEESERWSLRITEEGSHPHKGLRRLKTSDSETGEREFPIPCKLLELGFLAYVEWLKGKGEVALFPELRTKGARRLLFAGFSEFWSAYLRTNGIPLERGRQPAREFRHTWTTAARASGVPQDAREFIQGHSAAGGSANERYGSKVPLGLEIERVEFAGLDLSRVKPWEPPE